MIVADLVKRSLADFKAVGATGFPSHYAQYYVLYTDYIRLTTINNWKKVYAKKHLAEYYGLGIRTVHSIISAYEAPIVKKS